MRNSLNVAMYWQVISLWVRCTSAVRSFYVRLGTPTPDAPGDVSQPTPSVGAGDRLQLKQERTSFPRVLCVCEAHQQVGAEVMLKPFICGYTLQTTISFLKQVHMTSWNILYLFTLVTGLNLNLAFIAGCLLAAIAMICGVMIQRFKRAAVQYQPLPTTEQ